MSRLTRTVLCGTVLAATTLALMSVLAAGNSATLAIAQEPPPPEGQTYIGAKRCASCHFEQFLSWRQDKHSKAFDLLPEKYQTDAKCLKCHTTGYGEESGWKGLDDRALAGVTCEICHGPGSKHEKIAQPFAQTKDLAPEQEKELRDSIWLTLPKNVCIECHTTKAHKKSETPPELITKD